MLPRSMNPLPHRRPHVVCITADDRTAVVIGPDTAEKLKWVLDRLGLSATCRSANVLDALSVVDSIIKERSCFVQ